MVSILGSLVADHPMPTLLTASLALSILSLSLTPSFISQVLLLTSLLLFTRDATLDFRSVLQVVILWIGLTVSISISHLAPSIHALSTPLISIASLFLISGISSMVALAPVYLRHFSKKTPPHIRAIVFPTLWATVWLIASWASPLGRLVSWSPLSGVESYRWLRLLFGFTGLDWITAAWASVAAETLGNIFFEPEQRPLLVETDDDMGKPAGKSLGHLASLTGLLLVLTVPSFFMNRLPLPPISSSTTPLRVACVLPRASEESHLERFLGETRSHAALAKILVWPEGAVVFETEKDKTKALKEVQNITAQSKVWVGVSFEERVPATKFNTREGLRRNGMVLVGPDGVEMTYYKRRLVPIAESFSQISCDDGPSIHTIELPRPSDTRKGEWDPSGTRAIALSASICLDFSAPLTSLSSRPALVLAPAKTWHVQVGRAMYELARARGEEIGTEVLWCDGGEGGLSGVAGDVQVGEGTWVKTIGVPYPAQERRTLYGICGDWLALAAMWLVPAVFWAMQRSGGRVEQEGGSAIVWTKDRGRRIVAWIRGIRYRRREATPRPPESETLIDAT